jgi:hypothetical protein
MSFDLALGGDPGGPMNMFMGNNQVVKVIYVNNTLTEETLWTMPIITIASDVDGGLLSEVAAWVDEIPIIGPFIGAGIAFIGDLIQFLIPDGIAAILGTVTSIMRSEGTTGTDDSYVEVIVGSKGYTGLITDILTHYPENGSGSQGVGFRMVDSTLAIVQRSSGITNVVTGAGFYQIGDRLRLESWGLAHFHTLYRNGLIVGVYDDFGGITLGTGFRSIALSMQAEVATVGGARSTSPNITSLIAGDLQTILGTLIGAAGAAGGADAPTTAGGNDPFAGLTVVSASPGGAGTTGGADHTWSTVLPPGLTWLDQQS